MFGELGVTAPLDEIARRAGVGNATMYRHFPTRRELVIAVYAGEVSTLCQLGSALLADSSPAEALFRWLREFITHVATKRELPLAIPDDTAGQRTRSLTRACRSSMKPFVASADPRHRERSSVPAGADCGGSDRLG
ncbi:MAG: TetR/AcrR family transcriptional regulator, partial [Trebonia sp.]